MSNPIYEIPVTPPGSNADGWHPGTPSPIVEPSVRPSFESLLATPPTAYDPERDTTFAAAVAPTPAYVAPTTPEPVYAAPPEPSTVPAPSAPPAPFEPSVPLQAATATYPAPVESAFSAVPAPEPAPVPGPAPVTDSAPAASPFAAPGLSQFPAPSTAAVTVPIVQPAEPPTVEAPNFALADLLAPTVPLPGLAAPSAASLADLPAPAPEGRRSARADATGPTAILPQAETLTEVEREALRGADPELVAALHEVVLQRASDLHMTVNAAPMVRVDGGLRPVGDATPWDRERVLSALMSIVSPQQREMFERELELDFAFTISANARFRVNFYQQRGAVGAAFRLIPTEIKQLKELGVPESVGNFSKLARGLVLVTGPTGSGKSTTLAAMIDLVNSTRSDHIVTVEDPIEFMHTHKQSIVNQREVGADTHSFGAALKHVLRQDPDVILIGELRDLETISVALTAAETGHLVFATLHTQDAPQTIDRVIDVFPPHQQGQVRAQLAATLQGVVCQTLVKKASGQGRAVATEVLIMTPAIANLIREGKTYQIASMMQAGREQGMHTMDQHLADLVNNGKITHKAAIEKVHDPEGFGRLVQRVESPTEASARAIAESGIDFGDSYSGQVR
ncbi:PilT/PilU family type 4a pilus ATPase [Diaminobutyricibacter sp. McL0618]|uniref:type IV pilus twitching motility protein PilT n=1 Tax=Leifsonia sp. McL0618 TaxID=3415677 RepID=UPI003CEDD883